ncbi:hypothetical protein FB565_001008 [Actinoplanes lutulentus]|uniref:Integral membrane protein n=1 Tax=Actinoplanes lutulentus TaxID=1287878 RepID=A0A327ZDI2_9ACTN|nr:hypothetical protein [Actinoplanes lutulentus]MBB2941304.1 hypothetical protein [Actinoplanes lutulentus]RAK36796.1 hypothetical protein B0I29_10758 [Actinoplanes lutulentus]
MTIPVDEEPSVVPDDLEVSRLKAEVAALRAQLDARPRKRQTARTIRSALAAMLVALAAFALVTSVVGLWAARTTLDTDRWVATIAPLPADPRVNAAVAEYATTEVFAVVDVEQRLREVLPAQAAFVAGPIAGQLREQVRKTVQNVLGSDRFQVIWVSLNQQLHQRALAVLEGRSEVVTAASDSVQIDLLPLINQVLRELSAQLPTLFGKTVTLPDLSSGEIPANLRLRIEEAVGVTLPANFAQFTVYDSGQLYEAQQAVVTAKRYLAGFVALTLVLLIAAFVVSPGRRRTMVQLGLWLVIAAVAITVVLRAVRREILEAVPGGVYRDGVDAAVTTVFSLLRERGVQLIIIGVLLALIGYLAGPGRIPVWLRGQVRRGSAAGWRGMAAGGRVVADRGPGFVSRNLDPVRIGGLVVAVLAALIWSSWTGLLVIVILLAAFEVAVTLMARQYGPTESTV